MVDSDHGPVAGETPSNLSLFYSAQMSNAGLGVPWSEIPTHLLRAELERRQEDERPTCGTKGGKGHYNTPLHVFALILILALSTAGTCMH